jgi:hypothetical protein
VSADLELARLRLRQLSERLHARFPAAARDGKLASIYAGLQDAIGAGREASDPELTAYAGTDVSRQQLSPDLWAVVDASLNTVLEVTTPAGRVLARVLVRRLALRAALDDAYLLTVKAEGEAETRRLDGRHERRRTEGRLDKREAVEWLIRTGPVSRQRAVHMVNELSAGAAGGPLALGMTYADGYWRVPVQQKP